MCDHMCAPQVRSEARKKVSRRGSSSTKGKEAAGDAPIAERSEDRSPPKAAMVRWLRGFSGSMRTHARWYSGGIHAVARAHGRVGDV